MASLFDEKTVLARRLRGRSRRAVTLSTKITAEELELISSASETAGRAIGEWMREVLLREARPDADALRGEPLMAEVIGLQMFLTHVLSPIACGGQMTAEQYRELMRNVKANKRRAAREAIAQYMRDDKEEQHG
jgi:hypothetical protein